MASSSLNTYLSFKICYSIFWILPLFILCWLTSSLLPKYLKILISKSLHIVVFAFLVSSSEDHELHKSRNAFPLCSQQNGWHTMCVCFFLTMCSIHIYGASQVALAVKNPPANAGDIWDKGSIPGSGRSPGGGHGNPLQYSCWRIPWTKEPGGLQSMGSQRVRYDWSDLAGIRQAYTSTDWKDMYEGQDLKDSYLTSSPIRLARCYSPSLPLTTQSHVLWFRDQFRFGTQRTAPFCSHWLVRFYWLVLLSLSKTKVGQCRRCHRGWLSSFRAISRELRPGRVQMLSLRNSPPEATHKWSKGISPDTRPWAQWHKFISDIHAHSSLYCKKDSIGYWLGIAPPASDRLKFEFWLILIIMWLWIS